MADLIMLLIFAISGIIGYGLIGLIGRSIDRHTSGSNLPELEKKTDEYAETRKSERTYSCMPLFLNIQRKSHSRSF